MASLATGSDTQITTNALTLMPGSDFFATQMFLGRRVGLAKQVLMEELSGSGSRDDRCVSTKFNALHAKEVGKMHNAMLGQPNRAYRYRRSTRHKPGS